MTNIIFGIIGISLCFISFYYYYNLDRKSRKFHEAWNKLTPKEQIEIMQNLKEDEKSRFVNIYYGRFFKNKNYE